MKSKTFNIILLLLIGLTLLVIVIEKYLPEKRLVLLPHADLLLVPYADGGEGEGGNSEMRWIDEEDHHLECDIKPGAAYLFCGFNLLLERAPGKGLDFSDYQRLDVKLRYQGDASQVSFFMRHYDEAYSTATDGNSSLFIALQLRHEDVTEELRLGFHEFTIADWWKTAHRIPRELAHPRFSNITIMGMNFAEVGRHEVHLLEIAVVGEWISTERWYLMILAFWMVGALFYAVNRLLHLHRRATHFQSRVDQLASLNEELRFDRNKYQQMSQYDELTGVFNRYGFNQAVNDALANPSLRTTALILIDIDHFKRVNDRRGHDVGDRILKDIAQIIQSNIRAADTLGRWGGEEFILLCPNTDPQHAFMLAEKIRKIIFSTAFEKESPITVSASFGVSAVIREEGFEKAFKRADEALYTAKGEGRNCTVLAGSYAPEFAP